MYSEACFPLVFDTVLLSVNQKKQCLKRIPGVVRSRMVLLHLEVTTQGQRKLVQSHLYGKHLLLKRE